MNKEITTIRDQFPVFATHPDFVYCDTAATALTPKVVSDAIAKYYEQGSVNVHRGLYASGDTVTQQFEMARKKTAAFLHAPQAGNIVFTRGTTDSLNMLARSLAPTIGSEENVVLSAWEHHANLIPWQQAAKRYGFELRIIPLTHEAQLDIDAAETLIDEQTRVVSVAHVSNVLGHLAPIDALSARARSVGARIIIDAAQSVAHMPIDVQALDCDALVFSAHKLYGPTGLGVLYGKQEFLEGLAPSTYGGGMISAVRYQDASWASVPQKFEAGTPPIASVLGFAAAIDFVQALGFDMIMSHEQELMRSVFNQLIQNGNVEVFGSKNADDHQGVLSVKIADAHPHDAADIFARHNVAVRAGHHCAQPLMSELGVSGTVRLSSGVYNTRADVDAVCEAVKTVQRIFV